MSQSGSDVRDGGYAYMKILFVHQNFPGQYLHLARYLASFPDNQIVFLTQRKDQVALPGVKKLVYAPLRTVTPGMHHYLQESEAAVLNAQAVARAALDLKSQGFVPDIMLGHNGWGEAWYLKDIFPQTPLLSYFEFFYRYQGADVGFDPDEPPTFDSALRLRTKNIGNLLGLEAADLGQCPTHWQQSLYPEKYHSLLKVVHEGIDTDHVKPDEQAQLAIPGTELVLTKDQEVVTYVARNLEPYRGFPQFMRSLPRVLEKRPQAHVVIVGGDDVSYGSRLPAGQTFRQQMLAELGDALDLRRVHFLGKVPYPLFLKILQVSRAHIYLTYPFVLSWSMLEAMAAQCLVIGSATAPVQEVIRDGENGLLVDFFAPMDLADKLASALERRDSYAQIRHNARQTVLGRYDLRRICLPEQLGLLRGLNSGFGRYLLSSGDTLQGAALA